MTAHDPAVLVKAAEALCVEDDRESEHRDVEEDFPCSVCIWEAGTVLDAVADDLRADALREAATLWLSNPANPRDVGMWLGVVADRIEAGGRP